MTERDKKRLERWLSGLRSGSPLAIIMGGSVNGLSFVRSLRRRQVSTLLLDSERLVGTYTRYGKVMILPDPDDSPLAWLELLEIVGSRIESPGILFETSDVHSLFIAKHSDMLRRYFRFITPDINTLEKIINKRSQYTIAQNAGILIPRTYFPESPDEISSFADNIPYPCILKSYKSHLGRKKISKKVIVVNSLQELSDSFKQVATGDVQFMVQEIIPGDDSALYGYLALWDRNGTERAWLTKQKLRQCPPLYGDGSLQISVEAPKVGELSRRLLQAFGYQGFVGVEFKYDSRDQTYRLMEINPRTVSGNQLAISSGIDFPWIGYKYLTEGELEKMPARSFVTGIKYINEEWDFKAFLSLRKSGQLTFARWIRSIRGSKARAIWSTNDPLPMAVVLWRFLKAFIRGILKKFVPGKTSNKSNQEMKGGS